MNKLDPKEIREAVSGAVETILTNLAECDFASEYGSKTVSGLHEYKADMEDDILKALEAATGLTLREEIV